MKAGRAFRAQKTDSASVAAQATARGAGYEVMTAGPRQAAQRAAIDGLSRSPRVTGQAKAVSGMASRGAAPIQRLKYDANGAEKEATLGNDFRNHHLTDDFSEEAAKKKQAERAVVANTILDKAQFDTLKAPLLKPTGGYKIAFDVSAIDSITVDKHGKVDGSRKAKRVQGRRNEKAEDITHLG